MPSSASRWPLVRDTLRHHRTATLVWTAVGGLVLYGMGVAIATEMSDYPGGTAALAQSVEASARAMRPLRWPAERLDTLGGYVTYHNVMFVNLLLVIYAAVQGARAIRGDEERHGLEEVLATGVSRARVVRDRTAGFAVAMSLVVVGLGLGVAAGMAAGGDPDLPGSLITLAASGLAAMTGHGIGLLVSQLVGSSRTASGLAAGTVTALYVGTNVGDELGPLAFVQFLSPFTYANRSRALVPGHAFDLPATLVLLAMALALVAAATWAFVRRDYAAPLWVRRRGRSQRPAAGNAHVPTTMLGSVWTAILRRGWVSLLVWALSATAVTALMAALQPAVMDLWSAFDYIGAIAGTGVTAEAAYWSYAGGALVTPVIAAYVISQASGWVADLDQGRVELMLAGPVSWRRLVLERLLALVVSVAAISLAGLSTLVPIGAAVGSVPDAAGLGRLVVAFVMFGAALGGLAAILVSWLRQRAAVTALAVVVAASYVLAYLVPLLRWPEWLNKLSVFWAFGQPYLAWPPSAGIAVLLVLAVPGAVAAAAIAERTPKVA